METIEAVRTMALRSFKSGSALLHGEEKPFDVGVKGLVVMLLGDGTERSEFARTGIGKHDVQVAFFFFYGGVEAIEISET